MSLLHPGLEAFMAVVKRSTVHGAAEEIGLSQTGVTQRIRTLERQLRTTLFTRSRKGMRLTPEGESLHRYCAAARDLEGELLASFAGDRNEAVRVTITGASSIMRARVIPAVAGVLGSFQKLSVTFYLNDNDSPIASLKSGAAQLAVLERDQVVDELDSKILSAAAYILVGPRSWNGRPVREIVEQERIVDFNESDDATFSFLRKFKLLAHARKDRHLANNTDALASMVEQGLGYSVLSRDFASALLDKGDVVDLYPGKILPLSFALAWYPRHEMPAYFKALIKAIH